MNDDLNIPHCIGQYGADSYPCEQGFVPEEVFLQRLPRSPRTPSATPAPAPTRASPPRRRWEKLLKCCYYDTEVDF